MSRLVTLEDAGVSLGGHPVLRNVDFDLEPGAVAGVAGPNGSGKTTFVRTIATLTRLDQGSGRVMGAAITTDEVYGVRRSIALIGHLPALISELTLRENLEHASRLADADTLRIDQVLEIVGLDAVAGTLASQSSFGMKRRAEVARALLTRPTLLLLDEAMSGLDSEAKGLIDALISRTTSEGGGAVMVSHDPSHLAGRCDQLLELSDGSLRAAT